MTPPAPRDNEPDTEHHDRPRRRVTGDAAPVHRDTDLSPGDRAGRPNPPADESRYAATPAAGGQDAADAGDLDGAPGSRFRIEVEDGCVVAIVDPVLTDAAADVLWRIIEKAMRKEETA